MRKILGRILLFSAAFFGVMAIVFLIRNIFFEGATQDGIYTSCGFFATMLYGALLSLSLRYTLNAKRGRENDRNQLLAGAIFVILGTVICASMHIIFGIGQYWLAAVAYYIQSILIFSVCVVALRTI